MTGMKTLLLAMGLLALFLDARSMAQTAAADPTNHDLENIQGTWRVATLEADGQPAPREIVSTLKLVFKDDALAFKPGEPGYTNYKFTLGPATNPRTLIMTHVDGPAKGESQKCIYRLINNQLMICVGSVKQRPTGFKTSAGSGCGMYTLERDN
jgi:uncharacterized protein (TIGR03067 family)